MLKKLFTVLILGVIVTPVYSQNIITGNKFYQLFNDAAKAYLLNQNRPYIEIETDIPPKSKFEISTYPLGGGGYVDFPVYGKYSVSKKLALLGYTDVYSTAYDLAGNKYNGYGDSYAGASYEFQDSKMFQHFIEPTIKIPTASSENHMGTGKVDYDLGTGEALTYKDYYHDVTVDVDFLARADFPSANSGLPVRIQHYIDSVKNNYTYDFEQRLNLTYAPTYYFTDDFYADGGITFSRNMKLNVNVSYLYSEVDYTFTKKIDASVGVFASQYHYIDLNYSDAEVYGGVNYYPSKKVTLNLSGSVGIHNDTSFFLFCEFDFANYSLE